MDRSDGGPSSVGNPPLARASVDFDEVGSLNENQIPDDALDRCRHGKSALEFCELCDSAEIDLRPQEDVDLTSESEEAHNE